MMKRPADILREVIMNDPKGSQKQHRDEMWARTSPQMLEVIFAEWFDGRYGSYRVLPAVGGVTIERGRKPKPYKTNLIMAKQRADQITTAANEFRSKCLLDFILPDGTRLAEANAKQCRTAGGWLALVAKKLKAGMIVRTCFTNAQLHNLYTQAT